jgi:hypothetical protein
MVKSPAVSREMVQELAETGAIQVSSSALPNAQDLRELLGPSTRKTTTVTSGFETFRGLGVYPGLTEIALKILAISYGEEPTWERVRQQAFTAKICENGKWHKDGAGELSGISILFMASGKRRDKLSTAGRGNGPASMVKTYCYTDGPIVIAQKDFAKPLLADTDESGATWHTSERPHVSRVGVLDFWLN